MNTRELAHHFAAAFGRPAAMLPLLDPEVQWSLSTSAGVAPMHGHERVQWFLDGLYAQMLDRSSLEVTVEDLITTDDRAALQLHVVAQTPDGRAYDNANAGFLTVDAGRSARVDEHLDVAHGLSLITPPAENGDEQVRVARVASDHHEVFTSIEIDAPHGLVWATLTDFERIAEWCSTLVGVTGDFEANGVIHTTFRLGMGMTQTPSHELVYFEDGRQFGWSDPVLLGIRDNHKWFFVRFGDPLGARGSDVRGNGPS